MRNMESVAFPYGALRPSDHCDNLVFASTANKDYAVPEHCAFMVFSSNVDFWARFTSTAAAVIPSSDNIAGSGVVLNPTIRYVRGMSYVPIIVGSAGIVTVEVYRV